MADKKKKSDRHKPSVQVRLKKQLALIVANLGVVASGLQSATQWVNEAVRLRLVSEGEWPPKPKDE